MIRAVCLVIATALAGAPAGAVAQRAADSTRVLRGTVVDQATSAPIAGARVEAARSSRHATTDLDGGFAIAIATGDSLVIRAVGYRPVRLAATEVSARIELASAPAALPDLVVSAARRPQRAAETAASITTISKDELDATAAVSADQILATIPGIDILPNAPTGSNLSIRGIDGARVLVLIDGEPIVGSLLENRDLSRLSTVAVDRIEIVKGPQSALYGSDAIGGVVNLITADPSGSFGMAGVARFGSLGRRDAQLTAQSGGKLQYRLTAGWREQGAVASIDRSDDALNRVWDVRGTMRADLSREVRLRTDVSFLRERQRWRISSDGFNGFNDNVGVTGWAEGEWHRGSNGLRTRFAFERYEHRFRQARATAPIANDPALPQLEWAARATAAWNGRIGAQTLDAGLEAGRREIESPGKIAGPVSDDQIDGFLQATLTWGDLLITPATRVGWNSRWGSSITPGVNAAWLVTPALRVRGGLARGYRGPSFKELLWDFPNASAGYTIRGNPELVPERSWQLSAGAMVAVTDQLTIDGEVFRNEIRDLIQLSDGGVDPSTNFLLFTPTNVARARTQGLEVEARWSHRSLGLSAGYAYLDATDLSSGDPLDRRPRHSGRFKISWDDRRARGLRADLNLSVTGSAPLHEADGSIGRQATYASAGLQAGYDFSRTLGVTLGIDNLLDQAPEGWAGIYERRFYVGLRASWLGSGDR